MVDRQSGARRGLVTASLLVSTLVLALCAVTLPRADAAEFAGVLRSKAFFGAFDAANGCDLWVTNGKGKGTRLFKNINPGPGHSWPWGFTRFGGRLFFTAYSDGVGSEPWVTDGTKKGTRLFKDLVKGPEGSSGGEFTRLGKRLFCAATRPDTGWEL